MGAKKIEALLEVAPTLGHLEDLRGEASKKSLEQLFESLA